MQDYKRQIYTDCVVYKPYERLELALAYWECVAATSVKVFELVVSQLPSALESLECKGLILIVTTLQFHVFRIFIAMIACD